MNREEARSVLTDAVSEYRRRSYVELRPLVGDVFTRELGGPSGVEYQIEVDVMWDSRREKRDIRVAASIDDGRFLSGLRPVCDTFVVAPSDGSGDSGGAVQPAVAADGASPRR